VGEVPVTALRLPSAIFCKPFGLNRNKGSRVTGAGHLSVTIRLGLMGLDYGRWPKSNGTNPMSWGVALVCDEYRRWGRNQGHTIWPPNTTNAPH